MAPTMAATAQVHRPARASASQTQFQLPLSHNTTFLVEM
jgi:hypothetical protein